MPSENASPADAFHRLHPASLLFTIGATVYRLVIPGLIALFVARGRNFDLILMIFLVPAALVQVARYLSFRYRFATDELVIHEGIFIRKRRHIPYARIQNIDTVQTVLHRVLGVADVVIETAGGAAPEAKLSVLTMRAVEQMRAHVFEGRQSAAPVPALTAPASHQATGRIIADVGVGELVRLGLISNRGLGTLAAAFFVVWQSEFLSPERIGQYVTSLAVVDRFKAAGARVFLIVALVLAALIGLRLLSIGWAIATLYGFKLTREGEELRTGFGLLTRRTATIPRHRIQLLHVIASPLHRIFHRASLKADTAGSLLRGDAAAGREWLVPLLPHRRVPEVLAEVQPEALTDGAVWCGLHPRAAGRAVRIPLIVSLLLAGVAGWLVNPWVWAAVPIVAVLVIVLTHKQIQHTSYALLPSAVVLRSGWLDRCQTALRYAKVQAVMLHESPFDRRWGMATLVVDTATPGRFGKGLRLALLPRETALALRDRLIGEAAAADFRW